MAYKARFFTNLASDEFFYSTRSVGYRKTITTRSAYLPACTTHILRLQCSDLWRFPALGLSRAAPRHLGFSRYRSRTDSGGGALCNGRKHVHLQAGPSLFSCAARSSPARPCCVRMKVFGSSDPLDPVDNQWDLRHSSRQYHPIGNSKNRHCHRSQ